MTEPKKSELPGKRVHRSLSRATKRSVLTSRSGWKLFTGMIWQTLKTPGRLIEVAGTIFDADRRARAGRNSGIMACGPPRPVSGPSPKRKRLKDSFIGFGRVPMNEAGQFHFRTVKPGAVQEEGPARQAPHILVSVFMRGLLYRLITRIYFSDESANARRSGTPIRCSLIVATP